MTIVRSSCGVCGVIDVRTTDVALAFTRQGPKYWLTCPHCLDQIQGNATPLTVWLLRRERVAEVTVGVPAEVTDRARWTTIPITAAEANRITAQIACLPGAPGVPSAAPAACTDLTAVAEAIGVLTDHTDRADRAGEA